MLAPNLVNPLLDPAARPIIAHRGASGSAPENTIAAFSLAITQGADAIELDVRLTADKVPVVLHDATLDRTTGIHGVLGAYTLSELMKLDGGTRIPSLREVLRSFPEVPFLVEIKEIAAQEPVRQLVLEAGAAERCVFASEYHAALDAFRSPPFAVAASGPEIGALFRAALLRRVPGRVGYRTLSVPLRYRGLRVPTPRFVAAARRLGCPVHVWTVDDAATARKLWATGVSGIVTNHPERMRD